MKKRIGLFIGTVITEYLSKIASSMSEKLGDKYQLEIYSNIVGSGDRFFHKTWEDSVVNIPDISTFDALFVCPDSLNQDGLYDDLVARIEAEAHCPVVALRCRDERFYSILIDDAGAMRTVIEHMIDVHHKKNICFMTGRMDLEDARIRLGSYYQTMDDHGLDVDDHMVFEGDYWRLKGEEAVDWFFAGENKPEAIVCANDYMAISVANALIKRGCRIPEDVAVTGFDDLDEAKMYEPRIASMNMAVPDMCDMAINVMERLFAGEKVDRDTYVSVTPAFEGSCGCPHINDSNLCKKLYSKCAYLDNAIVQTTYMNSDFDNGISVDELLMTAFRFSYNFPYEYIYFCQCVEQDTEDDYVFNPEYFCKLSDRMILRGIMSHDESSCEMFNEEFDRKLIIPDRLREDGLPLYVIPIKCKSKSQGYFVVKTRKPEELERFFMVWLQSFSAGLDRIDRLARNKEYLKFREESRHDHLTGLYNRREMESILHRRRTGKVFNEFYIMGLDLDGLKYINDTFGHYEGDNALRAMADILKEICAEDETVKAARTGGDEFTVCIIGNQDSVPEAIKQKIRERIRLYNETQDKKYELSASMGYARFNRSAGITQCIIEADKYMYEEKQSKKHARK